MSQARKIDYDDAYARRADGATFKEIAAAYDVSASTAADAIYRMESNRGPARKPKSPTVVDVLSRQEIREVVWSILILDRDDDAVHRACRAGGVPVSMERITEIRALLDGVAGRGDRGFRGERGVDEALDLIGVRHP